MTDDDERAAVLACNEWARGGYQRDLLPAHVFEAGFAAGMQHARRWRPLTEDPGTWPDVGWVVVWDARMPTRTKAGRVLNETGADLMRQGWTHWLPLPPPSEEVGGG